MAVTHTTTVPTQARPATGTPRATDRKPFEAPLYTAAPRAPGGAMPMDTRDLLLGEDAMARTMDDDA